MNGFRIAQHPILHPEERSAITVYWKGEPLEAQAGETIAAALFAGGIRVFGHHHKDGTPQGIFCANGQCAQCLVLADGKPVKACVERVRPEMALAPMDGLPELPRGSEHSGFSEGRRFAPIETVSVPVLIVGGGPAGLSAALELGRKGIDVLLLDDKHRLGGKLVLQTHRFFGSADAVYAGTRGTDIATRLENDVRSLPNVRIWLGSTALAVFSDRKVGVLREDGRYVLVQPQQLLVAAGAREKTLAFGGSTLPGVYGAGAFQTLVNRDLIRPTDRLFIIGGGNVGLIAGYHALQAGVTVVGLAEALPECGGYKVHKDKLVRLGVPIYTSHTIVRANGAEGVESVTIARVDEQFRVVPGTEQTFACDTVLVAVGLDPVNEFAAKAKAFGLSTFMAGDAAEIAEASAAIFSGKITGREMLAAMGCEVEPVPEEWRRMGAILKSKPGAVKAEALPEQESGVFPVLHCLQEIPCNPCTSACPSHLIKIESADIRQTPRYVGADGDCAACEKCVATCPGLAISLVDYRKDAAFPTVTLPLEFGKERLAVGDEVVVLDTVGQELGTVTVTGLRALKAHDRTVTVKLRAPKAFAKRIAGMRIQPLAETVPLETAAPPVRSGSLHDDAIICRCGRVTAGEIRQWISRGYHDVNAIKVVTRATMGACGGKNCGPLIQRLLREAGVAPADMVPNVPRPLFVEVPLGAFAGVAEQEEVASDD